MIKLGFAAYLLVCSTLMANPVKAAPEDGPLGLTAIAPLKGYKCMTLRSQYISDDPDHDIEVPILEKPQKKAKTILIANSLILAKNPLVRKNNFIQIICINMRLGWIETRFVRNETHKCTPSIMSDGSPGARW